MQSCRLITPPPYLFAHPEQNKKEKLYYKCYYTTFVGDAIALSARNKPLNL